MELESTTITNTITSPTSTGPLTVTASGGANSAASAASTASTASTSTLAITSSTSLQPISSQAPVIGEKYYFSKTPISNDVAKAAAETVMAIASSALNASKSSSVLTKSESSNSTACPTTNGTTPVKNSSHQIVTGPAVSIISIDAKSEQPEITAPPQSSALVTKPITFLSIVDSNTKINMPLGTKIMDSSGACLEHHPGSSIGSNSVREVIHLDQGPPGAE